LLDAVGTRTVAVEEGSLHSYLGGWPEYVRIRDELRSSPQALKGKSSQHASLRQPPHVTAGTTNGSILDPEKDKPKQKPKSKGPSKNRLSDQQKAERAIEEAEAAMAALEQDLADPAAWASKYESAKSEARHTAARRAVEEAYERLGSLID
jgi:ATP-binding cassette, subfamily F, member 3